MFTFIIFIIIAGIGFVMGYIYKKSTTSLAFFTPNELGTLRNFMIVFTLGMIACFALSWYTLTTLGATEMPADNKLRFDNMRSVMIFFVNIFFLLMVVFSNLHSQGAKKLKIVPYLLAIGFYLVFTIKDNLYIAEIFSNWQRYYQLIASDVNTPAQKGLLKSAIAVSVTAFNAIMIWWGLRK
jgi:hypothetical protein